MIELQNVSKQYRGIPVNKDSGIYLWIKNLVSLTANRAAPVLALDRISFSVAPGSIFGIYGENGAGKTTLIKIMSGLLGPTGGQVRIDGRSDRRYIKSTISYISTNGWMGLEWQLSARENLILYGNLFGLSGRPLLRKCDEMLEAVGMIENKDKYVSQLSAGMRQKITIARGLVLDRPVVFYDEPSVSLDVQSARNLRSLITADAACCGRTAIIASHNPGDLAVCGRIAFLYRGRIIAEGSPEELKRPFGQTRIFEISYLRQGSDIQPPRLRGIERIVRSSREGERDIRIMKIHAGVGFSLNDLVRYFTENNITVQSIKPSGFSIREIYEYYIRREGESDYAV